MATVSGMNRENESHLSNVLKMITPAILQCHQFTLTSNHSSNKSSFSLGSALTEKMLRTSNNRSQKTKRNEIYDERCCRTPVFPLIVLLRFLLFRCVLFRLWKCMEVCTGSSIVSPAKRKPINFSAFLNDFIWWACVNGTFFGGVFFHRLLTEFFPEYFIIEQIFFMMGKKAMLSWPKWMENTTNKGWLVEFFLHLRGIWSAANKKESPFSVSLAKNETFLLNL